MFTASVPLLYPETPHMNVESIIRLIDAVGDSWSAIALLFLVGLFLLLWKFGRDIIKALQENTRKTERIQASIKTNHGSKNIGDAIDRLTTEVWRIKAHLGLEDED